MSRKVRTHAAATLDDALSAANTEQVLPQAPTPEPPQDELQAFLLTLDAERPLGELEPKSPYAAGLKIFAAFDEQDLCRKLNAVALSLGMEDDPSKPQQFVLAVEDAQGHRAAVWLPLQLPKSLPKFVALVEKSSYEQHGAGAIDAAIVATQVR